MKMAIKKIYCIDSFLRTWMISLTCKLMFADLTMAMQKLYQTFVAQAAQLQSVHENVKVGSLPSALSENTLIFR